MDGDAWRRRWLWLSMGREERSRLSIQLNWAAEQGESGEIERLWARGARAWNGDATLEKSIRANGAGHPASQALATRYARSRTSFGFALEAALGSGSPTMLEELIGRIPKRRIEGFGWAYAGSRVGSGLLALWGKDEGMALRWLGRIASQRPRLLPGLCGSVALGGAENLLLAVFEGARRLDEPAFFAEWERKCKAAALAAFSERRPRGGMVCLSRQTLSALVDSASAKEARRAGAMGWPSSELVELVDGKLASGGGGANPDPGEAAFNLVDALESVAARARDRQLAQWWRGADLVADMRSALAGADPEAIAMAAKRAGASRALDSDKGESRKECAAVFEALLAALDVERADALFEKSRAKPDDCPFHMVRRERRAIEGEAMPSVSVAKKPRRI